MFLGIWKLRIDHHDLYNKCNHVWHSVLKVIADAEIYQSVVYSDPGDVPLFSFVNHIDKGPLQGEKYCVQWSGFVREPRVSCTTRINEIVCRSGFANVNIRFLICLMFIFERPIQITLFRIHLVSAIKFVNTCQVRFWINYWRAWMDK